MLTELEHAYLFKRKSAASSKKVRLRFSRKTYYAAPAKRRSADQIKAAATQ
jgi:hypothetical protein